MDRPKLGFKLWFRKQKRNLKTKTKKLSNIINFLLVVAGTYLSGASYYLAKNDRSQQTQIDTLTHIVQQLRQANSLSQQQNESLVGIIKSSNDQSKLLSHELSLNINGQKLSNMFLLAKKNSERLKFETTVLFLSNRITYFQNGGNAFAQNERLAFVKTIDSLVVSQMDNSIILLDKINHNWANLRNLIANVLSSYSNIETYNGGYKEEYNAYTTKLIDTQYQIFIKELDYIYQYFLKLLVKREDLFIKLINRY